MIVSFMAKNFYVTTLFTIRFGPLYNFSAYPVESFYQIFKKLVRKGNQVLQQIVKRVMELNVLLLQGVPLKEKCSI